MTAETMLAETDSPSTLASHVYRLLRHDILTGVIAPGEKLRIKVVCARYGFGGSPVREALTRLAADGLVIQRDQKGFQVTSLTFEDLQELTRTRCLLNEITVRESLTRGDEAWEERIVMAHHRMRRVPSRLADGINPQWTQLHRAFHTSIIAACGSRWLIEFAEALFDQSELCRNFAAKRSTERDVPAEHRAIMEAAINRDVPRTITLLDHHFNLTSELVIQSGMIADAPPDARAAAPAPRKGGARETEPRPAAQGSAVSGQPLTPRAEKEAS